MNGLLTRILTRQFVIEHSRRRGWFLMDVNFNLENTTIVWTQNKDVCLAWQTVSLVDKFLKTIEISETRVNIIPVHGEE